MFKCSYRKSNLDHKPYGKMLKAVSYILDKTNHQFEFVDLGGGMGISYSNRNKTCLLYTSDAADD